MSQRHGHVDRQCEVLEDFSPTPQESPQTNGNDRKQNIVDCRVVGFAICLITVRLLRMTAMWRSGPTIRSRRVTGPRLSLINSPTAGHPDRNLRIVATGSTKIENAPLSPATFFRG